MCEWAAKQDKEVCNVSKRIVICVSTVVRFFFLIDVYFIQRAFEDGLYQRWTNISSKMPMCSQHIRRRFFTSPM